MRPRSTRHPDHDVAASELALAQSKRLARKTADSIARHCLPDQTLRDDEGKPWVLKLVRQALQNEALGSRAAPRFEHLCDRLRPQPLVWPQPGTRGQTPRRVRPFARRARITARPPRVRIRTRKP